VAPQFGFKINDGANARLNDVSVFNCQQYTLQNTSGAPVTIGLNAATLQDATSGDINLMVSGTTVFGQGNVNSTQNEIVPGVDIYGAFINLVDGDEGLNVLGELHVGTPSQGTESSFGEGDSYTNGTLVYTYNASTSAFVDVTASASSNTGSSFAYPSNAVDNAVYIASNIDTASGKTQHYGTKITAVSAHDGTGEIVVEYWNGSTWASLNFMVTDGISPFLPEAKALLQSNGISHQIRYDNTLAIDGWALSDPVSFGTDLYWVRYRISSATDIAPIIEQIKLHSSRTEVNEDGWMEYFGRARPIGKLPWNASQFAPASTNPGNGDVFYSTNLDIGLTENALSNGNRIGFQSTVPLDCDTSTPIDLNIAVRADSTGTWDYTVRWSRIEPDTPAYATSVSSPATHPNEQTFSTSASLSADALQWVHLDVDVSDALARRSGVFLI
jgi:hypothetical protein